MLKIGPVGNADNGRVWDEKDRNGIAQIFISHGDRIHSLQFQFVENGTLVLSDKHGDYGYSSYASKFSAVKLNYPSELITGISGYKSSTWGQRGVTSIIFTTNNGAYGPFGCPGDDDIQFEYQIGGHNKFCGFHGTAGGYLDSIGVYMEPMTTLSNVDNLSEKVKFNYPSELIIGTSGYPGKRDYIEGVTSIIFTTNNATYGPFGCPGEYDIAFDYQMGGHNKFCGFHSIADYYLYSIGVYMEPMMTISNPNPSPKPLFTASNLRMDKKIADLLSEQDPDALEGFKKTNAQRGTDVSIIHQNNYTIAAVKILTEYIEESSQKQIDLLQKLLNKVSTKKS